MLDKEERWVCGFQFNHCTINRRGIKPDFNTFQNFNSTIVRLIVK